MHDNLLNSDKRYLNFKYLCCHAGGCLHHSKAVSGYDFQGGHDQCIDGFAL